MIAESHITVHTFPERGIVWADIFSCKGFDGERALHELQEAFDLGEVRVGRLRRGLEYPHVVDEAIPLFEDERIDVVKDVVKSKNGKSRKPVAVAERARR